MDPLPEPKSLEEVQGWIRALYQPNPPQTIAVLEKALQKLQTSDEGWQLATSLMPSPDSNIKFFAALTLIVKLNRDSVKLTEDDAKGLLEVTIGWLLQSLTDGTPNFVLKKICTVLVTHFIYFSQYWPKCIRQLLYCLDLGRSAPFEALDESLDTGFLVGSLDPRKTWVAIQFASALVEEVAKTDLNSSKYLQIHDRLTSNASDVTHLLARSLNQTQEYGEASLRCYQAWILYAQRASATTECLITPLRGLVEPAIQCFANEALFQETAGLFSDILENYSGFFTESNYRMLFELFQTPWAARHYQQLLEDTMDQEGMAFGLLMLAYADARVQDLMTSNETGSIAFLDRMAGLLNAKGYLVAEDAIFVPALEFWCTFIETMTDTAYTDAQEAKPWRRSADQHVMNVVGSCLKKIQWPPADVFSQWDSSDRQAFSDARKDVADLLQSVFTLEGVSIVSSIVNMISQSFQNESWSEMESYLFCLSALSDCTSDEHRFDQELAKVFSALFFDLLSGSRGQMPLRLRKTGLSLIERYCDYFERHSEFLPNALNLLFSAVGETGIGPLSARSIATLCSSCRSLLTGQAGAFIGQYQAIRNSNSVLDSISEERIVLAIASIIQAIPQEDERLVMFTELFRFVKEDIARAVQLKAQPEILNLSDPNFARGLVSVGDVQISLPPEEIALQITLRALSNLSNMAKGMQDTKDHIIDLDADPRPVSRQGRLAGTQVEIAQLVTEAQRAFPNSGEAVETICSIFRAGFSESEPGPFVFPPEVVADFITSQSIQTPRVGTLLSTTCSFVGSLYRGPRAVVPQLLAQLLPWAVSLLQALPEPESDTEITQNGIVLVAKILPQYPSPLPKGAAAEFWSDFLSLKSSDPALSHIIASAMTTLGPLFCRALVRNIGGHASRSELDKLADPLKRLVTQQPGAQAWLQRALLDDDDGPDGGGFPGGRGCRGGRGGLRGSRQTNAVVKEFWLACRGSNFMYVS
ncbi:armadillo-type protein [Schizothecium vesticola]|uniref:Armadillo-type protein n=1 Tax=Schizothecium vesticola TaxID=314040 RepID=A0AA40BQW6_9PEZI|nr:armadillo-type protein [Schizothecium vesticola]